jgi:ribose-phosphate pyrophosphokinase
MIRTGGSLINAARAYKAAGAKKIITITTHGLFNGNALEKIKNSGVVEMVVTTNSHPNSNVANSGFLRVESIASLIVAQLI